MEYSTDETDEDKIPDMEEGMAFPRKVKMVKLTLPATPVTGSSGEKFCGMVCLLQHATRDASCLG